MAEQVLVDVETEAEAVDLSQALAVRGLPARPATIDGRPEVELSCRHEEIQRLLEDLLPALEAWRADRSRGPLRVTAARMSTSSGARSSRRPGRNRRPRPPLSGDRSQR